MANIMVISGYVKKVDMRQGFMTIQVSVPDGKDQQTGQSRYVPVTVHVSFSQNEQCYLSLSEGMSIMVQGRYRKYKTQDGAWYDQLNCYQGDVYVSQRPVQSQQGYQPAPQGYQPPMQNSQPYTGQQQGWQQAPAQPQGYQNAGGQGYDSIPF